MAFLEEMGAGKTVLLKIISGLYLPTNGNVLINGIDINQSNNYPLNMRILIEKPVFFPDLTGYENLKMLADINKIIDDSKIIEILKLVNLEEEMNKKYSKYSLEMKQKLGIAQVLMEDPDIIILDELFNGIENITVEKISNYLLSLKKKRKNYYY